MRNGWKIRLRPAVTCPITRPLQQVTRRNLRKLCLKLRHKAGNFPNKAEFSIVYRKSGVAGAFFRATEFCGIVMFPQQKPRGFLWLNRPSFSPTGI